jgi:hypothetical protein
MYGDMIGDNDLGVGLMLKVHNTKSRQIIKFPESMSWKLSQEKIICWCIYK